MSSQENLRLNVSTAMAFAETTISKLSAEIELVVSVVCVSEFVCVLCDCVCVFYFLCFSKLQNSLPRQSPDTAWTYVGINIHVH